MQRFFLRAMIYTFREKIFIGNGLITLVLIKMRPGELRTGGVNPSSLPPAPFSKHLETLRRHP